MLGFSGGYLTIYLALCVVIGLLLRSGLDIPLKIVFSAVLFALIALMIKVKDQIEGIKRNEF
jgi:biotin transporter BioY